MMNAPPPVPQGHLSPRSGAITTPAGPLTTVVGSLDGLADRMHRNAETLEHIADVLLGAVPREASANESARPPASVQQAISAAGERLAYAAQRIESVIDRLRSA